MKTSTTPTVWSSGNLNADGTFAKLGEPGGLFTFEEAQRACPDGWRLPTKKEFEELCQQESKWTGSGRKFANGVYLPAAGVRYFDGTALYSGRAGYYWTNTAYDSYYGHFLYFTSARVSPVLWGCYDNGRSVRCVRQEDSTIKNYGCKNSVDGSKGNYIEVDREILEGVCKYCENVQIYDKLGFYNDFYYKIKSLLKI